MTYLSPFEASISIHDACKMLDKNPRKKDGSLLTFLANIYTYANALYKRKLVNATDFTMRSTETRNVQNAVYCSCNSRCTDRTIY